jgi:hypothetical protein
MGELRVHGSGAAVQSFLATRILLAIHTSCPTSVLPYEQHSLGVDLKIHIPDVSVGPCHPLALFGIPVAQLFAGTDKHQALAEVHTVWHLEAQAELDSLSCVQGQADGLTCSDR